MGDLTMWSPASSTTSFDGTAGPPWGDYGSRGYHDLLARPLDAHLYIAPFQFKLGNVFFNQELDEFLKLFLIHRMF
jgi:hypothetical protein